MAKGQRKQYLLLAGVPILVRTMRRLQETEEIDEIYLIVPPGEVAYAADLLRGDYKIPKLSRIIEGGAHRQDSVRNGIEAARAEHGWIVIHDAVRPFVDRELLGEVIKGAKSCGAAIAAVPVRDTVKILDPQGRVGTLAREGLWLAQTPQAFQAEIIKKAHAEAHREGYLATDDAALVEKMGIEVKLILGSYHNIKITTPEDLLFGEFLAGQ